MRQFPTQIFVEIALCIALAVVLSAIRIFQMPYGGTVSLVMLPLIVIALRRGVLAGVIAGAGYGLIELMIEPWIVHPAQVLLDYPLAFGVIGLAGIFHARWQHGISANRVRDAIWSAVLPAVIVATFARYVLHVASGYIFFAEYAPEGQPVIVYALLYNLFVPVSALGVFAAAAVVLPALARHSFPRSADRSSG